MGGEHQVVARGRPTAYGRRARTPGAARRPERVRGSARRACRRRTRRHRRPARPPTARPPARCSAPPAGSGRPAPRHRRARDVGRLDLQQLPRRDPRRACRRQRRGRDPAHRRRSGGTGGRVAGLEADRARGGRPDPGARPAPQRGGAVARLPRPLRTRARDRRARRGSSARDARRRRPRDRGTLRGVEGGARRDTRGALRLPADRPAPVALRRPVLPDAADWRGIGARRALRAGRPRGAHPSHVRRHRSRRAAGAGRQRSLRARRQEPARVLHRHRP